MCKTFILYKKSNVWTFIKQSTITPYNNYTDTETGTLKPSKVEYTIIWHQILCTRTHFNWYFKLCAAVSRYILWNSKCEYKRSKNQKDSENKHPRND
jgi:hypothetical protein